MDSHLNEGQHKSCLVCGSGISRAGGSSRNRKPGAVSGTHRNASHKKIQVWEHLLQEKSRGEVKSDLIIVLV